PHVSAPVVRIAPVLEVPEVLPEIPDLVVPPPVPAVVRAPFPPTAVVLAVAPPAAVSSAPIPLPALQVPPPVAAPPRMRRAPRVAPSALGLPPRTPATSPTPTIGVP